MPTAAAMFALYVIWGSTYLAIRIAIDPEVGFPPLYMAAIRQLTAGGILYVVMRLTGAPRPTRAQWRGGFIVGALLVTGGNGGISLGERSVDSSFAAIVVASMPLWVAVMGLYYGHKPTRRELFGLCVGFSGVVVLNAGARAVIGSDPIAFAAVIASPILWAWGSVLGSRIELARGPMASATQMLCGGAVLVGLGAAFGEHFTQTPDRRSRSARSRISSGSARSSRSPHTASCCAPCGPRSRRAMRTSIRSSRSCSASRLRARPSQRARSSRPR